MTLRSLKCSVWMMVLLTNIRGKVTSFILLEVEIPACPLGRNEHYQLEKLDRSLGREGNVQMWKYEVVNDWVYPMSLF